MKLLIYTQKIDKDDTVLGFFHDWVLKLSVFFENITVVCLEKGNFEFPEKVKVVSLGKERGGTRLKYIINFYKLLIGLQGTYDSVFIHMNQEYVLLGGLYWKLQKRILPLRSSLTIRNLSIRNRKKNAMPKNRRKMSV
jgi:hypothetical protein